MFWWYFSLWNNDGRTASIIPYHNRKLFVFPSQNCARQKNANFLCNFFFQLIAFYIKHDKERIFWHERNKTVVKDMVFCLFFSSLLCLLGFYITLKNDVEIQKTLRNNVDDDAGVIVTDKGGRDEVGNGKRSVIEMPSQQKHICSIFFFFVFLN